MINVSKRQKFGLLLFVCAAAVWAFDSEENKSVSQTKGYEAAGADEQPLRPSDFQNPDEYLRASMARGQRNVERSLQAYIEQDREKLEVELQRYTELTGVRLSLEEYVPQKVDTEARKNLQAANGGTNPIFEQQKRQFAAGQKAHFDRQQQFGAQNEAWNQQQQAIQNNHDTFIQQGIQGNQFYKNTETGAVAELPFAGDTGIYGDANGNTFESGKMGEFNQIGPDGSRQELQGIDSGYSE